MGGGGLFLSRIALYYVQNHASADFITMFLPEYAFFILFGILLFLFDSFTSHGHRIAVYVPGILVIDFLSNCIELFGRIGKEAFTTRQILILFAVACVRAILLVVVLKTLDRYRLILVSKSHADRYHRLVLLLSKLRGETVWMNKNIDTIESTMNTAYHLYGDLQTREEIMEESLNPRDWENRKALSLDALSVAKDVHEIKKEYLLIKRGIEDAMDGESMKGGMAISEVLAILNQSVGSVYSGTNRPPIIIMEMANALYTEDPYLLLSVFHNLITNAVEACGKKACRILIKQTEEKETYVYTVIDNGPGVKKAYIDQIFEPRFSTKFDEKSGEISRGLGLPIVKDIVENNLGGTVCFVPTKRGACFRITIPKERLKSIKRNNQLTDTP